MRQLQQQKEDEKLELQQQKEGVIQQLKEDKQKLTNELRDIVEVQLRFQKKLHIRGALEYVRTQADKKTKSDMNVSEPSDKVLRKLMNSDADFKKAMLTACEVNQLRPDDVEKCLGALYHEASKNFHGHDRNVAIDHRDWADNEVLALAVLFTYFKVKFVYLDVDGFEMPLPYTI